MNRNRRRYLDTRKNSFKDLVGVEKIIIMDKQVQSSKTWARLSEIHRRDKTTGVLYKPDNINLYRLYPNNFRAGFSDWHNNWVIIVIKDAYKLTV